MAADASRLAGPPPSPPTSRFWPKWLCRGLLALWLLQVLGLGVALRGEILEVGQRLVHRTGGAAVRLEDPFYRWLVKLRDIIPPGAAYLFLDNYEAGVEIEARYHLFPRRHHLLPPDAPPSFLFHVLRDQNIAYLVERQARSRPGPGLRAAKDVNAAIFLDIPGPGLVYRVEQNRIKGGFYD